MDIQPTLAARLYGGANALTAPQTTAANTFADVAATTVRNLQATEALAKDALLGKADPHAMVEALAQTELAVETAVTLRDKVVEAYQEILRMPV